MQFGKIADMCLIRIKFGAFKNLCFLAIHTDMEGLATETSAIISMKVLIHSPQSLHTGDGCVGPYS